MENCYVNDFSTSINTYYKDIKKYNPISKEEEKILMHKAKNNDIDARNKILTSNLKFVFDVAKSFKGYGVPLEDLISEGNIGLAYAFEKFDENKDIKFISYAVWWIKWYMMDFIKRKGIKEQHELQEEEILSKDIDNNVIQDSEDENIKFGDTIMSNELDMIEEENERERRQLIKKLLDKLDYRERKIIECYFGLGSGKSMTLDECGKVLNLTGERVRQLKAKSLLKLRSEILLFS